MTKVENLLPDYTLEDPFSPKNRQPSKHKYGLYLIPEYIERIPVCPQYQLIEICAELAGINPEDLTNRDKFCGIDNQNPFFLDIGKGEPYATCTDITHMLNQQLAQVEDKKKKSMQMN